jgi:[acyl-carrier-protein] S-malonyltransferase
MIAFTFPGQGSQRPGMGAAWSDHPSWELVAEASEVAERDLEALLLHADADELVQTQNAQLATFLTSLVVLDAVERTGVEPARVAGHSLGEYTALVAAGAVSFEDGVRLVTERGNAMRVAAEEQNGTMAAVLGLDDDKVEIACARVDGDVWVANFNAPGQVVIAGDPEAIVEATAIAKELGARKVLPLAVGGAFHTPFMGPAAERLSAALAATAFADAEVPIVANVDGLPHQHADQWLGLLDAQLTSPVRWRQSVERMVADGVTAFLELGPGAVLTGLAKRAGPDVVAQSAAEPAQLDRVVEVAGSAGSLDHHDGEHLFASERLVVSPAAGVFTPAEDVAEGQHIERGRVVGHVAGHEVRSPFRGTVKGLLAVAGERLTRSQPVAWLRTA